MLVRLLQYGFTYKTKDQQNLVLIAKPTNLENSYLVLKIKLSHEWTVIKLFY